MPESPSDVPPPVVEQAPGAKRRHGNKPVIFIIGVLVAGVVAIGWGSALLSYGGAGGVSMQTVAWRVLSDAEATITFQVNSREPVECLVTATDAQHVEVGQTSVEVEAGIQDVTTSVETIREASAVQVASCREQGSTK
ncbi:DUF4307 domain-containing protein [Nocardiopsis sediminis]|uniref:DUF4307 domain-containing protein n=1 Tax=Nocardiopsis sediminis TaxID=1778267 RepID=A0ABV8FNY1_9ACTN